MDAKVAARIQALTTVSGWDDLKEILAAQEERFWDRHRADVKLGKPIDQRELDRAMGKLDGIRAILGAPDKADVIMRRSDEQEEEAADE